MFCDKQSEQRFSVAADCRFNVNLAQIRYCAMVVETLFSIQSNSLELNASSVQTA